MSKAESKRLYRMAELESKLAHLDRQEEMLLEAARDLGNFREELRSELEKLEECAPVRFEDMPVGCEFRILDRLDEEGNDRDGVRRFKTSNIQYVTIIDCRAAVCNVNHGLTSYDRNHLEVVI